MCCQPVKPTDSILSMTPIAATRAPSQPQTHICERGPRTQAYPCCRSTDDLSPMHWHVHHYDCQTCGSADRAGALLC
jgi:hypothetical protein